MRYSISNTAEYGDLTRGPRLITQETRDEMKKILREIQSGAFAKEWMDENRTGRSNLTEMRNVARNHPVEEVGEKLRSMMPWIQRGRLVDKAVN